MATSKCKMCSKTVYPMDPQINLDGSKFHKACAKCGDCDCQITISNFTKNESSDQTVLLCKIHYFKRFHEGGSYLGGEKFRVKSTRDMKLPASTEAAGATPTTVFKATQDEKEEPVHSAYKRDNLKSVSAGVDSPTKPAAAAAEDRPTSSPAAQVAEEPVPVEVAVAEVEVVAEASSDSSVAVDELAAETEKVAVSAPDSNEE